MVKYFLLGPIPIKTDFIISHIKDNLAYFLTIDKDEALAFDILPSTKKSELVILNATITDDGYKIAIKTDNISSFLAINNEGIIIKSDVFSPLKPLSTQAAQWSANIPFLAGIDYTLTDAAKAATQPVKFNIFDGQNISTIETFMVISTIYYTPFKGCNTNTSVDVMVAAQTAFALGKENLDFPFGYTNAADCATNNVYQYCNIDQTCGDANCRGPCPNEDKTEVCAYRGTSYSCKIDRSGQPWYFNGWIIFGIIVFIILIVILISFIGKKD